LLRFTSLLWHKADSAVGSSLVAGCELLPVIIAECAGVATASIFGTSSSKDESALAPMIIQH